MPVFLLCIRAELENVASLAVDPTSRFCLDVQESGGAEVRRGVYVTSTEEAELSGSKGTAHFVMKFSKDSKRECSVTVQEVKGVTRAFTADDVSKFVPIMAFECRGLDPIAFEPTADCRWTITSEGGAKFADVDLSDKDGWCDFDEKAQVSVGVYKLEAKFEVHRG